MPFSIKKLSFHKSSSLQGSRAGPEVKKNDESPGQQAVSQGSSPQPGSQNAVPPPVPAKTNGRILRKSLSQDESRQVAGRRRAGLPQSRSIETAELRRQNYLEELGYDLHDIEAAHERHRQPIPIYGPPRWRARPPDLRRMYSEQGPPAEARRVAFRRNVERFSDNDWANEENYSTSSSSGGGGGGQTRGSWRSSHRGDRAGPRGESGGRPMQSSMRRQPARRHHSPHLEPPNSQVPPVGPQPPYIRGPSPQRTYCTPPPSVYDDDPGIMSEAETSATGFRRNSKVRSSLPVVRTPCKTQERPLGLVFLQYRSETKRALLPNEITTMDTVKALFVRSFSKQLTMKYLESPHIRIYIHDAAKDMFYELEDLRDVRDRSVLRIYERSGNGDAWEPEPSYFSEPELDSEYQNQHIHRTKNGKLPPYYDSPEGYSPNSRPMHAGVPIRPYSPIERGKIPTLNNSCSYYNTQTLPRGTHIIPYTPPPQSPPDLRKDHLLSPGDCGLHLHVDGVCCPGSTPGPPPMKPQRAFQQPPMVLTLPERRHEVFRPTPERPFPAFHPEPRLYQTSPSREPPSYPYATYTEDFYAGDQMYGTGSITPVVDEEARVRVEHMERQLATLTGLVQKALTKPSKNQQSPTQPQQPPPQQAAPTAQAPKYREDPDELSEAKSSKSSSSSSLAEEYSTKQDRLTTPKMSSKEKSVSFSEETTTVSSPIQRQHSPQTIEKPAKPAIKSSSIRSQSSAESEFVPKSKSKGDRSSGGGKPAPPPKPASLDSKPSSKELRFTPKICQQLHTLKKQTKDLRVEVRNLRRIAQAQAITAKETVRDACVKIKAMLAALQLEEEQICGEKFRITREGDVYRQDVTHLEKDLADLENQVEEVRSGVINKKCRVNMSDVEGMALVLSHASKTVADLKSRFPGLQDGMKTLVTSEMESVVREEKFLKEEPDRLETALKRCKKLTGTLVTLKRLASVQEQRNTGGGLSLPERSESAHSDGEAHPAKELGAIHVPPDGHQMPTVSSQQIIDSILDDLASRRGADSPIRQPPQKASSLESGIRREPLPRVIIKKVPPTPPPENPTLGRTSALSDEARADSNSSSSESINSQEGLQRLRIIDPVNGDVKKGSRQEMQEHRQQQLLKKQKALQDQYARLQQIQRGQRFSPPRGKTRLSDLKKTGSESNILAKSALHFGPGGSLTHLAPTTPPRLSPNNMFETDIV